MKQSTDLFLLISRPSKSEFYFSGNKNPVSSYKKIINELPTFDCLSTPEVHDSFKIHRNCDKQHIHFISDYSFKKISSHSVITFQIPDHRLYGCSSTVALAFCFRYIIIRLRYADGGFINCFRFSITSVDKNIFVFVFSEPFVLFYCLW